MGIALKNLLGIESYIKGQTKIERLIQRCTS